MPEASSRTKLNKCTKWKPTALKSVKANTRIKSLKSTNSMVNLVLNSKATYYSPLKEIFPKSDVQQGVEFLFSLETIDIPNETVSDYYSVEIAKFKKIY